MATDRVIEVVNEPGELAASPRPSASGVNLAAAT